MNRLNCMLLLGLLCGPQLVIARDTVSTVAATSMAIESAAPLSRVTDQPNAILLALKQNDFAALLETSSEQGNIVAIAKEWDERVLRLREHRAEQKKQETEGEPSNAAKDKMQLIWEKLQSAEGVDLLVDEWQPEIAREIADSVMKFNLGFGAALAAIASDQKLNAEEVRQLTQLMYAVQNWTGRVDFADPERLRRALTAVSRLVRQTGLKRFDETEVLSFEEAVVHGDTLIATVKQALAAYDIPVDEILNSVRLSEIEASGDQATLLVEARVLGVDIRHGFPQRYFGGRWQDAEVVEAQRQWQEQQAEEQRKADEAAKANVTLDAPNPSPMLPAEQ